MGMKEAQEKLAASLKQWQRLEDETVSMTAQIIGKTQNPVVRSVMEIIQKDCQSHRQMQQLAIDSVEGVISLTPDELGDISELIDHHIAMERRATSIAAELLEAIKGSKMLVPKYALEYLLQDESKHEDMLMRLDAIKGGMYPYA